MTVHALGDAACLLNSLDDDAPPLWQVWTLDGRCLVDGLSDPPDGHWTLPDYSYDARHTWGVMLHGRGFRSQTRVDDLVRPLTMGEKMALTAAFRLTMPPPALLGVLYSMPLHEVTLGERWLLREVGVVCALTGQPDADYEVLPLRLFHSAVQETYEPAAPDSIPLAHPDVLLHREGTLLMVDGGDRPRVIVWSVSHA